MRVYDMNLTGAAAAEAGRTQDTQRVDRTAASRTGGSGNGNTGDRVEFSSTLGRLSRALEASGAERSARVQELAAQYQSGKYLPNAAAAAKGMVSEALAMGIG